MKMVKILLDCFGGDHSPEANVDGGLQALKAMPDLELILTGDEEALKKALSGKEYDKARLSIVHAPEVIDPGEKPTDAIRLKKESSMMKAVRMLRDDDEIAGMVSTGSTGALVAAALTRLGRVPGVIRPTFCPILPTLKGGIVGICDSGANVDVTPEYLKQYAIMASLYMENVYGVRNPRVALLNIGTEDEKGDALRKEAFPLLRETKGINFVGNMEARTLLAGTADVVVCDGFAGNVLIKSTEGTALELLKHVKTLIEGNLRYKIGAAFMYKMLMEQKELLNYQNYGGSVLLGTQKVVVKGHGSSKATAVTKCIEQAYQMHTKDLSGKIEAGLSENGFN
ncbi:MAG: phosphate acyltransferase PlsX [Lachnospiraceae bacterium]|nr:phosphate acyltransferase PlsX [Lachnospiraceae bacterium]